MNHDWEKLLQSGDLEVPKDFTHRVMQALPEAVPSPRRQWPVGLFVAAGASAIGLIEITAAIFSAWAMSPAF